MSALTPPPFPVGIDSDFVYQQESSFRLLNLGKFWTRGDMTVNTTNETAIGICNVPAVLFSAITSDGYAHTRIEIADANGNPLYKMRLDSSKWHFTYYLDRADGTRVAECVANYGDITIKAPNIWNEHFDVLLDGQPIAYFDRHDYNGKVAKAEKACQSYDVKVASGVHAALVLFSVMVIEDYITIFRVTALFNPVSASMVGITAMMRGRKNKNAAGPQSPDELPQPPSEAQLPLMDGQRPSDVPQPLSSGRLSPSFDKQEQPPPGYPQSQQPLQNSQWQQQPCSGPQQGFPGDKQPYALSQQVPPGQ